jgi:chitinase
LTPFVSTDYAWMSPEICQSLCPEYSYFGVEYGGECYCGNSINNGSTIVDDSQCDLPCGGFPDEYCGAGNRLDLYWCPSSSSTSSAAASTSSSSSSTYSAAPSTSTSSSWPTSSSTYSAAPSTSTSSSYPTSTSSSYPSSSTSSSYPTSSTSSSYASSSSTAIYSASGSSSSSTVIYSASGSSSSSTVSYSASVSSSSSTAIYSASVSSTSSTAIYSASSSSHTPSYTTSTITTTTVRTISSCAPTVTNCPYGKVLTDTIEITTTFCPYESSSAAVTTTSAPAQTTLTIYTTTVYTVTSCAPTVTNCPAKLGAVTTETIIDYTTVCPISEALSKGLITAPTGTSTSTVLSSLTIVKLVTETVKPLSYAPSSNYTVATSTAALTYSSSPSTSPISFKGAASGLQAGSGLAMVIVVAAAALFL